MMSLDIEAFVESPFVNIDFGSWQIDEDAPEELKERFNEFKELLEQNKVT